MNTDVYEGQPPTECKPESCEIEQLPSIERAWVKNWLPPLAASDIRPTSGEDIYLGVMIVIIVGTMIFFGWLIG